MTDQTGGPLYLTAWILRRCQGIDKFFKLKRGLAAVYVRAWNPINYAIVGGIGVLINMLVAWIFWSYLPLPWWFINAVAILVAWLWNWANSVGPLGWIWGFRKRGVKSEDKHSDA